MSELLRSPPGSREFRIIGVLLVLLGLTGYFTGLSWWPVIAGLLLYLVWNLYCLWRLVGWLDKSRARLPVDTPGIWGYVFQRLEARRRKSSARKKQVARLLKSFRESTSALPDATAVLNNDFTIQWVNEASTEILGLRRSDAGQPITSLVRDERFRQYLQQQDFGVPFVLAGLLWPEQRLALRIIPFGDGQLLLQARDVTEQHKVDQMRRDFVANASHELRTPLSVLQGSVEQLEALVDGQPACARPLERMRRQSTRMMRILEDLLVLARLEGGVGVSHLPVPLSVLAGDVAEEARVASEQAGGHRLQFEIEPDIHLEGRHEDLRAAMSNLVMNAIRYTPPGGEIRMVLRRVPDGVEFKVADTGSGIPPQHLMRLTERFYRVDVGRSRQAGGTGLGLSIVRHVLDRYNTQLSISSTPGRGSVFAFRIGADYLCRPGPHAVAGRGGA